MNIIFKIGLVITSLAFANLTFAESCDSSCQLSQINSYFAALDNVSRKNSSIKDIDSLLALTHQDVKYIHVEYQANFTKESWRKAFIRNLERGAYQNSDINEMRIINSIYGKNHTAIEYSHGVIQPDGTWQQTAPLLVIFGFTDGKISLIKELW
ncbi:nuclear transport factor 2 family protein [Colwelliaceae bacterium BS250]